MVKKILLFIILLLSLHHASSQIKSPSEFLEYPLGSQFSRHADIIGYFKHIAEQSPLVSFTEYGKTNENRWLGYAVISSEENMGRIEEIRLNHLRHAGIVEGEAIKDLAVIWLSYNVHGNEASSSEAAMKTLYSLITEKQAWLKNTVVIIDPCLNPDGRDRYVNWYNQVKATPYDVSQDAAEHFEPWPGGRPNHYLFDLNRDWVWASQKETRARLKIYNQWMPHIHVDFHEQGINNPYYFAPAAKPFHDIITPFQRDFQTRIGKNNARYFDREGWLYFTKERFDLLYPSYGDTYPTYMGAIGMTYEQAGHGRSGLGIQTDQKYILTLEDRIAHHFTTGISTIEMAHENAGELLSEYGKYFRNTNRKYSSYVMTGSRDKINALKKLLDRHEIRYRAAGKGIKIPGFQYSTQENGHLTTTENTLVVSTSQPKGHMVEVLFEPETDLEDSLTYDITAWSLPFAYGLDAVASKKEVPGIQPAKENIPENSPKPESTGYIAKWNSMDDARFLSALLKEGIKVRYNLLPFSLEDHSFTAGSLIITNSDNQNLKNFQPRLTEIANNYQRELTQVHTGFASDGPDFGSPDVKLIDPPSIAMLRGEGTSSLNYGEIWYFFEQELQYPVTSIGTSHFDQIDLDTYSTLIVPEGRYEKVLGSSGMDKIRNFIRKGGKIIAIADAIEYFTGQDGFSIKKNKTDTSTRSLPNLTPYNLREREQIKDLITGSIIKTELDPTHPLAFGYDNHYYSLKQSGISYSLLNNGYNVAYIEQPEVISGFVGSNAAKRLNHSLIFGQENIGAGRMVYMVDNPLFRSFWENGKLFFVNALFMID